MTWFVSTASELRFARLPVIALDELEDRSRCCSALTCDCDSPLPDRLLSPALGAALTGTMVVLLTGTFDECSFSSLELEEGIMDWLEEEGAEDWLEEEEEEGVLLLA